VRILGNLDCEARWANVALPATVQQRISLYAALLAAFSDERCDIWAPAAVDASRLVAARGWVPPTMHVAPPGPSRPDPSRPDPSRIDTSRADSSRTSGPYDLVWADPTAREANDRATAFAIAERLGIALPGARLVGSLAELDAAASAIPGPWVAKARWTSAGRDRAQGTGAPAGELRARVTALLARFGSLVIEPWLERLVDVGICGTIGPGGVELAAPHGLLTTSRGGFLGIDTAPPALEHAERAELERVAHAAAAALPYRGPFTIDAFVYTRDGERRLHALCEINARHTFGGVARALARRLGIQRLGFGEPPAGVTLLIAPGPDHVVAWCA
jgi:hypothetical protein